MLEIERDFFGLKRKDIWFSARPYDVDGYQSVMFYSCKDKVDAPGFRRKDFSTIVIDLTQDLETLGKSLDKWERKKINKARNNGVVIRINQHYEEFFDLYRAFRRSKGLVPWSLDVDFMRKYGTLFVALYEDEVIAGHFFLHDPDHVRGLITGSKRLEAKGCRTNVIGYANRLMIWEAICHFREKGIPEYDMGGYYTGLESDGQMERINSVKAGFGGTVVTRYHYEKHYSKLFGIARQTYDLGLAGLYKTGPAMESSIKRLIRGGTP